MYMIMLGGDPADRGSDDDSDCEYASYSESDEKKIYGGCFSCGEISLPDVDQHIDGPFIISGGSKKSMSPDLDVSSASGVSGFAYIVSDDSLVAGGESECEECAITVDGPVCSGNNALVVLKNYVEKKDTVVKENEPTAIVEAAKKITGCVTEECALRTIAQEDPGVRIVIAETIRDNFKVEGPADSTKWLTNKNIDSVLAQICKKYPSVLRLEYHMIDMIDPESPNTAQGDITLKNISVIKNVLQAGKDMVCVVINTDKTNGPGIHWFCLFFDFRHAGTSEDPYTIEYFNSSGSRARSEVAECMHRIESEIDSYSGPLGKKYAKRITAATIQHQKDTDSECGVYSLYYIWRRINGAPIEEFSTRIPDAQMVKFRGKLYRNRKASPAN